jgi:hypothetical protein
VTSRDGTEINGSVARAPGIGIGHTQPDISTSLRPDHGSLSRHSSTTTPASIGFGFFNYLPLTPVNKKTAPGLSGSGFV